MVPWRKRRTPEATLLLRLEFLPAVQYDSPRVKAPIFETSEFQGNFKKWSLGWPVRPSVDYSPRSLIRIMGPIPRMPPTSWQTGRKRATLDKCDCVWKMENLKSETWIASQQSLVHEDRSWGEFVTFDFFLIHVVAVVHCGAHAYNLRAQKALAQKVAWLSKVGDMCHCHRGIFALLRWIPVAAAQNAVERMDGIDFGKTNHKTEHRTWPPSSHWAKTFVHHYKKSRRSGAGLLQICRV